MDHGGGPVTHEEQPRNINGEDYKGYNNKVKKRVHGDSSLMRRAGRTRTMNSAPSIHLEGFSESLRGVRSYFVAPALTTKGAQQMLRGKLAALDTAVAHRGRKVLVVQGSSQSKWLLTQQAWDAVFHLRDVQDLKLALTYIQHCGKPVRVVWAGTEPSGSVLQTLLKYDQLTLVGIGERTPVSLEWQAIFWSPDSSFEELESGVGARMGATGTLRSVSKELRASEVGLVWSSIGESEKKGCLYWYDPAEGASGTQFDPREAAEVLRQVADSLSGGKA